VEFAESWIVILKGALGGKLVVETTVRVVSVLPILEASVVSAKFEKFSAQTVLRLSRKTKVTSRASLAL
jgi:hypothetical protein